MALVVGGVAFTTLIDPLLTLVTVACLTFAAVGRFGAALTVTTTRRLVPNRPLDLLGAGNAPIRAAPVPE